MVVNAGVSVSSGAKETGNIAGFISSNVPEFIGCHRLIEKVTRE